ncbi:MAG TPA: holo-ACP synthase [Bacillota bacterium]|nr:holo-ACP synthase [Bacillota bacterium]
MIHGVGVDILDIDRIRPLSADWNDSFFIKTFTEKERAEAALREDPSRYFAGRFSAKEAVFKALRIPSDAIRLNEIEILNDAENKPCVHLLSRAEQVATGLGVGRLSVSLSNDGDFVISFAICEYAD